jgi:hypothetical protein
MKAISRILLATVASGGLALSALGQQASITLKNSNVTFCNTQDAKWTIKISDGVPPADYQQRDTDGGYAENIAHPTVTNNSTITWNVTATRQLIPNSQTITAHGYLTVTNTGSAPATIGNIVINLQKQKTSGKKTYWVSAAADMANAISGSAATSANIVAAGSQEDPSINALIGPPNYTVSGDRGTFVKTAGSGTVDFTYADNTLFAMTPQPTIAVGASVNLIYHATFDNSILNIPNGASLRLEAIVTFGNAGLRGGGGSTGKNIDVNGDGVVDSSTAVQAGEQGANDGDEANVRSVPSRFTMNLPAMEICNAKTTLVGSLFATPADTIVLTNFTTDIGGAGSLPDQTVPGDGVFPNLYPFATEVLDTTGNFSNAPIVFNRSFSGTLLNPVNVVTSPDAFGAGGAATLSGAGDYAYLNDPEHPILDLLGNVIGYQQFQFECCAPFSMTVLAWPWIDVAPPETPKKYTTYSQGGFQGGGTPGQIFDNNFTTVFAAGLTIGLEDGSGPNHDATWIGTAGHDALKAFLGGGGQSEPLNADTQNATSVSGGALAVQTAALTLNIRFNDAGLLSGTLLPPFGTLTLKGFGNALDGMTINQVLADANTTLGTPGTPPEHGSGPDTPGWLPSYEGSAADLEALVENLNLAFHEGNVSGWATLHINY